jgi:hypothetical protein
MFLTVTVDSEYFIRDITNDILSDIKIAGRNETMHTDYFDPN